jgi:putative addiction module component (TIGR02574 family)
MSVSFESLGIDRLTVGERLELVESIWDSLPPHVDSADVPEWHLAELKKRREEVDVTPLAGKPWRDVLDRLGKES